MRTIWWIIGIILAAAAILLLISLGRPPSVSEATSDFCADVSDYSQALLNLRTIDENSTVADLQAGWATVLESREALVESSADLREARLEALEATGDELQTTVQSIPDDATLAQAQATLRLGTLNAVAAAVDTLTTTCEISIPRGATTRPQR
jgi:chromosome condensin MukBEF complex kleisin-like MukF subunit